MEAMLFQVAERSLRFCRLFETKNVNGKICLLYTSDAADEL